MLTFEALAILILGFAGGRFVSGGFVGDFFNVHPQFMLYWKLTPMGFFIDLVALLGFLILTYGAQRAWSKALTYRFIFLLGVVMFSCVTAYQLLSRVVYGDPYGTHDGTVETEIAACFTCFDFTAFHSHLTLCHLWVICFPKNTDNFVSF
jgi:hypothetical protein